MLFPVSLVGASVVNSYITNVLFPVSLVGASVVN